MKHFLLLLLNVNRHAILLFSLLFISTFHKPLTAQYLMDWQVSQHYYEIGVPYFDINGDGTPELTKYLGNTVTVFDGTQNWSIVWSITAAGYDELVLWDLYSVGGDRKALCLAATLFDQVNSTVLMYDLYGETPVWSTSSFEGYYSNVVITDLNGTESDEILLGCNIWNESTARYSCRFYVLNGETGSVDYESSAFNGYMYGPYAGDLDGNGIKEILVNVYTADSTSTLSVFSYHGSNSVKAITPEYFHMDAAYPNPFNSSITVPFKVSHRSDVSLRLFDITGRPVHTIPTHILPAGDYHYKLNLEEKSSGVYLLQMRVGDSVEDQKVVQVK